MIVMMETTIIAVVLLVLTITVNCDRRIIERKYGKLSPFFNQTSWGSFRRFRGDVEEVKISSIWMQDDLNKRCRNDIGKRGEAGFVAEFYFLRNETYELRPVENGKYECVRIPDFNYTMEIQTYGNPNFGFLGRHVLQEFGGITADVYAGQAVDGVGPLNCLVYCDSETCGKFLGLTVIGTANRFSYLEYWFGDNLSSVIPPSHWYDLPGECKSAKTEFYFQKRNSDGSVKQELSAPTDNGFCLKNYGSRDMSLVLYRSLCCGLEKSISN